MLVVIFCIYTCTSTTTLIMNYVGWDVGCLSMKLGEKAQFTLSADKAYGKSGFPAWGYPFNIVLYLYVCSLL